MSDSLCAGALIKTDPCNTQLRAEKTETKTKSSTAPSFGKPASKLRFMAMIPRYMPRDGVFKSRAERCEFVLGLGPCGLHVSALHYELDADYLIITQEAGPSMLAVSDVKKFIYLVREIVGRIEVTSM